MNTSNTTAYPFGHSLSRSFSISLAMYFLCVVFIGIISNVLIVSTIFRRKSLRTATNYFIANLALCDVFICCFAIPFDAEFLLQGYYKHGNTLCGFKEIAFMFYLPSSVVNLFLLTLERFITVTFSFQSIKIFHKKNVIIMITGVWFYTLLVALFPLFLSKSPVKVESGICWLEFPKEYVYYQLSANFLLPVPCIIFLNFFLLRIASKHERVIRGQTCSNNNDSCKATSLISLLTNIKAAKTVMLLVGVFILCWVTYIGIITSNILCANCQPREVIWTGNAINYSSVVLNPLLYGLRSNTIRREVKKTFRCYLRPQHRFEERHTFLSSLRKEQQNSTSNFSLAVPGSAGNIASSPRLLSSENPQKNRLTKLMSNE